MKSSNDYWAKRKAQFMVKQMGRAEDTAQLMNQGYYLAQKRLEEESEKIFQRFQRSYGLTEQQARDLIYRAGTNVDSVKRELENMNINADVLAEMNSAAYAHRIEALRNSSLEIDKMVERLAKRDTGIVTAHLKRTAEDAYLHSIYLTQQQAGVSFNFTQFDEQVVEDLLKVNWSKKHFSESIWDNTHRLGETLKEEFMVNYLTGRSADDMAKQIASRMGVSYFNARRLVRTESTYVEAEMEALGYEEAHIDEYEYVSVLDNRTSSLCREHDGKIYKVKDRKPGVNYPPLHVFCRATTIAHIPDDYERELTDKDIRNIERMSFKEWKQNVASEHSFNTDDDPIREIMGSMFESHTYEVNDLVRKLDTIGVKVVFTDSNHMSYQPTRLGKAGIIRIDRNASYSALLHEYTHAMDDFESGWKGIMYVWEPEKQWAFEEHAYDVEIEFARLNKLDESYIIRLEELKESERKRIFRK